MTKGQKSAMLAPVSGVPYFRAVICALLAHGDLVGFTFLLGTLAMFGAGIFFLMERGQMPARWRTPMLVSALITFAAGSNYVLMTHAWLTTHASPLEFRYVDWFITVPLLCLQFFLLLQAAGARPGAGIVWRLVLAAVWMLAAGYVGQAVQPEQSILWGALSSVGWAVILFEISFGEVEHLSQASANPKLKATFDLLFGFILFGWAIYPLGYLTNPGNLLAPWRHFLNVDVIFNLGDAVNKVGFGLVIWNLARAEGLAAAPAA